LATGQGTTEKISRVSVAPSPIAKQPSFTSSTHRCIQCQESCHTYTCTLHNKVTRLIISNFPQCIVQLSAFFQGKEFAYLHVYCFQLKEREFEDYNPWGRPGGGAPIRTQSGKVVADFKAMTKVSLCTGVLMSTMLTWHIWHRCLLKLALPFYCKFHLFTVLKDNNKSQQNIYFRHSLMLLWLKMNVTIAVFARVVINRVGLLLPRYMILRFRENMPQCKGFLGNINMPQ